MGQRWEPGGGWRTRREWDGHAGCVPTLLGHVVAAVASVVVPGVFVLLSGDAVKGWWQ